MAKTKMRETYRLIRNIALCVMKDGEPLKEAEKAVRKNLLLSSRQNAKPIVVILREMWNDLKDGSPHKVMSRMVKEDYVSSESIDDFERKKAVLKNYQTKAKRWNTTREAAKQKGLI
jgi:hypothetical protein